MSGDGRTGFEGDPRRAAPPSAADQALEVVAQRPEGALGRLVALLAVIAAIAVTVAVIVARTESPSALDPTVLVVAPVQATGSAGPGLSGEVTSLLSTGMEGRRGLRVLDSGSAWTGPGEGEGGGGSNARNEALRVARELGAGWLLLGEAAGSAERVSLTASLYHVRTGGIEARAHAAGNPDSLAAAVARLVDRLESFDAALR